jgi:hypothetical protein
VKVVSVSLVRNEADIIEPFVRHTAEVVDAMVVVDHRSVDGTDEILRELATEGLPVSLRHEHSLVQRQWQVLTGLMREEATAGRADWVLPVDADEFLVGVNGPGARAALEELPGDSPALVDMRTYVPTSDDPGDEPNTLKRIQWRRRTETTSWYRKVFVPKPFAADDRYALLQGSHGLCDTSSNDEVPAPGAQHLALAHFPVRSSHQLATKALAGWLSHIARTDRLDDEAFQWKRTFDTVASGRPLTSRRLQSLAQVYSIADPDDPGDTSLVHDPVHADFELRCSRGNPPARLSVLAGTAEALIEELSDSLRASDN